MTTLRSHDWNRAFRNDPENAWASFVQESNRLLMAVIAKLVQDHDDQMELYTYVLEQFKKDKYNKIMAYFEQPRNYEFETWIVVATRNCCFDWFRRKGRNRLFECIKKLPAIEQTIFQCIYQKGYSTELTFQLLKAQHGFEGHYGEMLILLDKIHDTLNSETRFRLFENRQALLPLLSFDNVDELAHSNRNEPNNEQQLIHEETKGILNEILDTLPHLEKLIIQLHVIREMTLEQTARILKMGSIWQVHRKLKKALQALKVKLKERGINSGRKVSIVPVENCGVSC